MVQRILAIIALAVGMAWSQGDGTLEVTTDPEGVEIWLNDKYIGDSPIMDKRLKPGRYTVRLVDPVQHASATEEVFIQAGQTTVIEKTITAKFGSLRVDSDPQGAEVSIATPLGKTPLANDLMNPGRYRLEIRHPSKNYTPVTADITIPRGETVSLSKTLEKQSPFDTKALVRLGLGVGTAAGFVWAIIEQGNKKKYKEEAKYHEQLWGTNDAMKNQEREDLNSSSRSAGARRTIGIILGGVCLVGLEIVAFF